ncbi:MAG: 2-phospho-L-lactate guanylyltransferase, coenzyme F420 biosynthesis enzyme, CobY/MobA/RfbA family [Chloroflexi bacterium AL-W]|nr:2-phospho-L-lactate guanylyltransferase, coenzyme F420 biosynthesis enzyme, CobY/MobA/RfbA family [Chloroflexi bacterium AL-N1]NOK70500.1 2-phospho-L-lactate guanylyltransferase, coenzyme F420 biosynthesis enzyme, CobY/MobA/RfbA family [Chloroflexi bacterium AL-N10]NOK78141.1 2-phospho-L-lactate guanylyltransferase, coenzyme F420 biosynthesis enzyme, CobY/MobA/RfbA family [Chloroflexi bacterium AL-N5]NOK85240.1 2-phospho-L-lactate guanylyltransferase, coenzyme F420 biosynthesis enzyme, CobY/M
MIYAIVPVKQLDQAKSRLSKILTPAARQKLVLTMLCDVLRTLLHNPMIDGVGVISGDATVLALAASEGAEPLLDQTADLNSALVQASRHVAARGATGVLVLPADVPLVTDRDIAALLDASGVGPGIVIAPSPDGGTNALLIRPPSAVPFQFGLESLQRHCEAAQQRDLAIQVINAAGLSMDIDNCDDLVQLTEANGQTATQQLVRHLLMTTRMPCI